MVAGDTLKWFKNVEHYRANDGWTLTYYLQGPAAQTLTASQEGSSARFSVSIAATVTALWPPGEYKLYGFASKAGERYGVFEGEFEVLPNFAVQVGKHETRSLAKQTLDALEELLLIRATRPELQYSLGGPARSFTYKSDKEIIDAIDRLKPIVAAETPTGNAKIVKMKFQHAT